MDNACGQDCFFKEGERGAARLKFILVIALIAVVGYAGYQYVPVAYQASGFKDAMRTAVRNADAMNQSSEDLRKRLRIVADEWSVPPNAEITAERSSNGRVQARVRYTRPIVSPVYTYVYNFDYTAQSTELLGAK
ncbi:MAG TPA: hypothetical protein VGO69_03955 [Pyrinomonadaceae bacterium]|jgi:hypothetical protein|nr:hypothetical protein [Pyrinomonadaceae bacterium]